MAKPGSPSLGGLALLALAAFLLSACGGAGGEASVEEPAAPFLAEPPELAPLQERHPEMFDDQGCLRIGDSEVDCTSRQADIDAAVAEDPSAVRELRGFVGSGWATELSGKLVLVDGSISVTAEGTWAARGLVRNERPAQVGSITVGADLVGADGQVLAEVAATSPVAPVRPGEPVPFALVAEEVPAGEVADVHWRLEEGDASGEARDLEIAEFWSRGFAEPRSAESYLYDDSSDPQSHVRFGSVTNLAGRGLDEVTVVVAWLSDDGKVLAVAKGAAVPVRPEDDIDTAAPQLLEEGHSDVPALPDGTSQESGQLGPPVTEGIGTGRAGSDQSRVGDAVIDGPRAARGRPALGPEASADFVVVVEAGQAPGSIDDALTYLWAVGR